MFFPEFLLLGAKWVRDEYTPKFLDYKFLSGPSTPDVVRNGIGKDKTYLGSGMSITGIFSKFSHSAHVNIISSTMKKLARLGWLNEEHFSFSGSSWSLRINGTCLNMPNYMFFFPPWGEEIKNINHSFQTQYLSSKNKFWVVKNYMLRLYKTLRMYFWLDRILVT